MRRGYLMLAITLKGSLTKITLDIKANRTKAVAAAVSALNKTAERARTDGARTLARSKRVAYRFTRKRTVLVRANRSMLVAHLIALNMPIPIEKLPHRVLKRGGVSAAGRKYPHAFKATMPSGHRGVYERRVGARRLPIAKPVVALQPEADQVYGKAVREARLKHFVPLYERELQRRLKR
jgi:hypothetical protein